MKKYCENRRLRLVAACFRVASCTNSLRHIHRLFQCLESLENVRPPILLHAASLARCRWSTAAWYASPPATLTRPTLDAREQAYADYEREQAEAWKAGPLCPSRMGPGRETGLATAPSRLDMNPADHARRSASLLQDAVGKLHLSTRLSETKLPLAPLKVASDKTRLGSIGANAPKFGRNNFSTHGPFDESAYRITEGFE